MTIYILGESTVEQTIVDGKPGFTRSIQEGLALNGYRMVLAGPDKDQYDHKEYIVFAEHSKINLNDVELMKDQGLKINIIRVKD